MDFGGSSDEQKLALRRKITETKAVDQLDVVFLLDDSGSISDADFAVMGQVCERICLELNTKNVRFAIITFHSSSTTICELNSDKSVVLNALKSYNRTKGSTNLNSGLERAKKMFESARGRASARRVAFTITDGMPDSDPSSDALKLKLLNVISYCIGVGRGVKMESLDKVASFGCSLLVKDMDQIINLFNAPLATSEVIHAQHVVVQATITKIPIRFQEDIHLRLSVQNVGHQLIPSGVFVAIFGGEYLHNATHKIPFDIPVNGEYSFDITLHATRKSFAFIPDVLTFTLTHPHGGNVFCSHNEIALSSEYFIGSFVNFRPTAHTVQALNILLFGVIGCGKSSFLNSILSAFCSEVKDPANVGGAQDHITRQYRCFNMGDQIPTVPGLPINLWDTWGLDGETYSSHFLLKLLEGEIPSGFDMENVRMDGSVTQQIPEDQPPNARRIHGVLLFVPIGILEDDVLILRVVEVLKEMNRKSLQTLIIVTRADTIDMSSRFAHQHAIAKRFNVPDYKVCLVTNYTKSREKDFSIDKVTLRIFAETIQIADTYAKTYCSSPSSPARPTPSYTTPPASPYTTTPPTSPIPAASKNMDIPQKEDSSSAIKLVRSDLTSVTIHFGGKKATLAVNDSTTFESLLATAAQKGKVKAEDYCLASHETGGVEYSLRDIVRAALPPGESSIYMRKEEGFE